MTTTAFVPASPAQINFILDLQGYAKEDDNRCEAYLAVEETFTKAEASKEIDRLKALKASKPVITVKSITPAVGNASKGEWHFVNGAFFLVAKSQGSGNLYAKKRLAGGGFDYAPGVVKSLNAATKVGPQHLADIAAYGEQHDSCLFCSLPLDVPESRLAGYGKKCADNHGLPYGDH